MVVGLILGMGFAIIWVDEEFLRVMVATLALRVLMLPTVVEVLLYMQ